MALDLSVDLFGRSFSRSATSRRTRSSTPPAVGRLKQEKRELPRGPPARRQVDRADLEKDRRAPGSGSRSPPTTKAPTSRTWAPPAPISARRVGQGHRPACSAVSTTRSSSGASARRTSRRWRRPRACPSTTPDRRGPPDPGPGRPADHPRAPSRSRCARSRWPYVGDARGNMGDELLIGSATMGMDLRIVAPRAVWPPRTSWPRPASWRPAAGPGSR